MAGGESPLGARRRRERAGADGPTCDAEARWRAGGATRRALLAASARDEVGEGRLAAVPDRLAAWPAARELHPRRRAGERRTR